MACGIAITILLSGCGTQRSGTVAAPTVSVSNAPRSGSPVTPGLEVPSSPAPATIATPLPEPPLGQIPVVNSSIQVKMPLDPYMASDADILEISIARDVAAAKCMRALGFTKWTAGILASFDAGDRGGSNDLQFIDPAKAAQSGYIRPQPVVELSGKKIPARVKYSPSQDEMAAFSGSAAATRNGLKIPAKGCRQQGEDEVYKETRDLPADPRAIAGQATTDARNHSKVREALAEWRRCIAENNLNYQDPIFAQLDARWVSRDSSAPASAEELRVASVDAQCRQKVDLIGIYSAAMTAYQGVLISQHTKELVDSKGIFDGWVANAKKIQSSPENQALY
jgi:hypothetical protein